MQKETRSKLGVATKYHKADLKKKKDSNKIPFRHYMKGQSNKKIYHESNL